MQSFRFLYPAWLLALIPLWASIAWMAFRHARDGSWSQVIDASLLAAIRLEGGARGSAPWWILGLVWTLAVVALAGPAWEREESPAFRSPQDWIVLLDLSPSMAARDVTPDRVTRARYVVEDILSAARDARVGLIVFGGDSHAVTPLTSDVETVRALLKPLAPDIMPVAGDLLAPALDAAAGLLKSVASRDAQVIVLTDGFSDPSAALKSAGQLRAQGTSVHVIGIGSANGAPVPEDNGSFSRDAQGQPVLVKLPTDLLQHVAAAGGGEYTALGGERQLILSLQEHRSSNDTSGEKIGDVELNAWRNEGIWLLPPLLLLAALLARRGWV